MPPFSASVSSSMAVSASSSLCSAAICASLVNPSAFLARNRKISEPSIIAMVITKDASPMVPRFAMISSFAPIRAPISSTSNTIAIVWIVLVQPSLSRYARTLLPTIPLTTIMPIYKIMSDIVSFLLLQLFQLTPLKPLRPRLPVDGLMLPVLFILLYFSRNVTLFPTKYHAYFHRICAYFLHACRLYRLRKHDTIRV